MHILVGLVALVSLIWASAQYLDQAFHGYLNYSALILLVGAPWAIVVISFDFGTLGDAFKTLWQSLVHRGGSDQTQLLRDLYRFGRTVREGRTAEAGRLLSSDSTHPLLRDVGSLVLARADAEAISDTVATVTYARAQRIKRAEEVLQTLGRVAPAMGMTGTVIGMIQLLSHLEQFDKLGSGMAVAMVSTLYGLVLQHMVYTPLARMIDVYGRRFTVNMRLLERGLVAVATQRPLHDLRMLAGESESDGGPAITEEAA